MEGRPNRISDRNVVLRQAANGLTGLVLREFVQLVNNVPFWFLSRSVARMELRLRTDKRLEGTLGQIALAIEY